MPSYINNGEPIFVMTSGVGDRVANDEKFSRAVIRATKRFLAKDWGDVDAEDNETNNQMDRSLDLNGGGMVLASYYKQKDKIWIIRDTERMTILFPDEY
jgi:hypothetical protein